MDTIKTNELRRGNYVDFEGGFQEIVTIRTSEVNLSHVGNEHWTTDIHVDLIKPIKLTEEWLTKFGFGEHNEKPYNSGYQWHNLEMFKHQTIFEAIIVNGSGQYAARPRMNVGVKIKYVHQLQNLCFSITGIELTL